MGDTPLQPDEATGPSTDIERPAQYPTATKIENGVAYDVAGKELGSVSDEAASPAQPVQKPKFDPSKPIQDVSAAAPVKPKFDPSKPIQDAPVEKQPEEIGKLHKLWNWMSDGLISKDTILDVLQRASATGKYQDVMTARYHPTIHIPGFGDIDADTLQSGVSQSSSGVASSLTSPLSVALFATGAVAGKAGQAAVAAKSTQAAKAAEGAVSAADAALAARTTEVGRAAQQANDARLAAEAAEVAEKAGTGTRAATIAAQDTASQAAANAMRAQEVLKTAQEVRAVNAVEAAKATRDAEKAAELARKAGKLGELSPQVGKAAQVASRTAGIGFGVQGAKEALTGQQEGETFADSLERRLMGAGFAMMGSAGELRGTPGAERPIEEIPGKIGEAYEKWHQERAAKTADVSDVANSARKDYKAAIPSTKAAPYTDNELAIGENYLEHHHANVEPVNDIRGVRDAYEYERQGIENTVSGLVRQIANEPLSLENGDEVNVRADVTKALAAADKTKAGTLKKGLAALEDYNLTDPTMEEADATRARLNSENRGVLKSNKWDVQTARDNDPAFAAREAAAKSLREGIYGRLKYRGVKGVDEMRSDESALINLRNAAERQLYSGEKNVRGTSEAGPVRKLLAKGASGTGVAVGAGLGELTGIPGAPEVGGVVGGYVGKKVGDVLAPPDLTRDALIERRMSKKIATGVPTQPEGTILPRALPAERIPQAPFSEHMIPELQKLRGEYTPLHNDLATHYGESLGDTPYSDLEEQFLSDVKIKKQHKVPLDPAEKKLLAGINQAKVDEVLQSRGQAEEQRKAAEAAAKEAEKERKEKEALGLKTNLASPFETEPHLHPEDERALQHEIGHHLQIAKAGHPTKDIISRLHEQIDPGTDAEARWHQDAFFDEDGKINLDYVKDNIESLLDIFHGGPVADEVMNGVPVHQNAGARMDLRRARTKLIEAGFTPSEVGQMMAASETRVRKDFTTPGVRDIFQRYAQAREAGLDIDTLMSEETSGRAIQEFKDALEGGNESNDKPPTTGKSGRSNKKDNTGRASAVPTGRAKEPRAASETRESAGSQGGHAGGGVASVEELARPGRFVKISRSGAATDQGKVPDFLSLGVGEAGYQVKPDGTFELKAGQETPATKLGVQGYAKEAFGKKNGSKAATVADHANEFNKAVGRPPVNAEPVPHNPEVAGRIAQAYEALPHNPSDPAVQKSYDAAKNDIDAQWDYAQNKMGMKFEPWTKEGQPYANSKEMTADVKNNSHLYFFQGGELPPDHPMAATDPKTGLSYNDKLRAVHDLFGHAAHEFQFGPKGEENAWNVHRQMFSPEAIPAITTETRGQNSWVNYGQHLRVPFKEGRTVPPERTTGQYDAAIGSGGAIPGGIQKGDPDIGIPDLALFHDPTTGSTLAMKTDSITPEAVRRQLQTSRATYLKARPEESRLPEKGQPGFLPPTERPYAQNKAGLLPAEFHQPNTPQGELKANRATALPKHGGEVLDQMRQNLGESTDASKVKNGASFITPEGTFLHLGPGEHHPGAIEAAGGTPLHEDIQGGMGQTIRVLRSDTRPAFLEESGAIRVRHNYGKAGETLQISVPAQGVTEEQVAALRKAVGQGLGRNGNLYIERADVNVDTKDSLTAHKEFARPSDVDGLLKKIQAYPDKNAPPNDSILGKQLKTNLTAAPVAEKAEWHETAADRAAKEPAGGIDPYTGESATEGIGTELVPEARQPLPRVPHAEDFKSYRDQHEHLFQRHPELKVGWDNNSNVEGGHELNIGAVGPNAAEVARKLGQRSAWDIGQQKEIPTGGTGEQTHFPDYSIEQRLAELGKMPEDAAQSLKTNKAHEDTTVVSPKGSSVGLQTNPLPLKPSTETGVPSTVDVAMALSKYTKKELGALPFGKAEPADQIARAKSLAEDEARYQLAQNNTGAAWYTTDMAKHDEILQGMRPELKDPAKLSLFKMAEAVLSSGQKPYANFKQAVRSWDHYNETGKFSSVNPDTRNSWGPRGIPAYGNAMEMLNQLVAKHGEQGASDWLFAEHPVSELKEYNPNGVYGKKADMQPGVMVLGPKRGPFAQNLHGRESAFTADLWVARTWNRWMGTAEVAPDGELITDRPRSGRERNIMKQSFKETADNLGISTSSLQAVLWYYEQALYSAHGSPKESWSFSTAAQRVADEEASSFKFGANEPGAKEGLDILAGKR